jgi:hypothetical protein
LGVPRLVGNPARFVFRSIKRPRFGNLRHASRVAPARPRRDPSWAAASRRRGAIDAVLRAMADGAAADPESGREPMAASAVCGDHGVTAKRTPRLSHLSEKKGSEPPSAVGRRPGRGTVTRPGHGL